MPDASGALTPVDKAKVRNWFDAHWKGVVSCPVCKTSAWTYGTHVVRMPRFAADADVPGTVAYPYLPVSCNTCAHTIFFGAATMGLFVPPSPPPPLPPATSPEPNPFTRTPPRYLPSPRQGS